MQQRRPRLGDVLDDYCPRERRVTNHVVVAMIEDQVKQTRCTTCDGDHDYKQARTPSPRKSKPVAAIQDGAEAFESKPVLAAPVRGSTDGSADSPPDDDAMAADGTSRPWPPPRRQRRPRRRPLSLTRRWSVPPVRSLQSLTAATRGHSSIPTTRARCIAASFAPRCRAPKGTFPSGRSRSSPSASRAPAALVAGAGKWTAIASATATRAAVANAPRADSAPAVGTPGSVAASATVRDNSRSGQGGRPPGQDGQRGGRPDGVGNSRGQRGPGSGRRRGGR